MPADHPALAARRRVADRATRSSEPGDWCDQATRPRARRLGVRVRQRLVSRHRRHGGDPDGAPAHPPLGRAARSERAIARGLNWTLGMQSRNGGWGAFDTDNTRELPEPDPVRRHGGDDRPADRGPHRPPPRADGRRIGYDLRLRSARRARASSSCAARSEPSGSWWGRWGVNFIYGTWSVLSGLRAIGEDLDAPYVRRAVAGSSRHQNADGGWGETCRSYDDESLAGRVASTPSQTAWALLGLLAGEERVSPELVRGIEHLLAHPAATTAPGTRRSSPAPGSRATSTSATTCTGTTSR